MPKYETHIGRNIKTTPKQHRLRRRALKRDPDAKYRMGKQAYREADKLNRLVVIGEVCTRLKNEHKPIWLLNNSGEHAQIYNRKTFDF